MKKKKKIKTEDPINDVETTEHEEEHKKKKKKIKTEDPINDVETTEHEEEHKKKKKKKVKQEHVENENVTYGKRFTDFPFQ